MLAALVAVPVLLFLGGCADDDERDGAVARLRADGWSRTEAECYVDLAIDGGGSGVLDDDAELTPDRLDALYQASRRCRELPAQFVELGGTSGTALVTVDQVDEALDRLTDDELVEWARLHGYEPDDAATPIDLSRREALRDLTLERGFAFDEALCISDELVRQTGRPGLGSGSGDDGDQAALTAAVAVCAPTSGR